MKNKQKQKKEIYKETGKYSEGNESTQKHRVKLIQNHNILTIDFYAIDRNNYWQGVWSGYSRCYGEIKLGFFL